MKQKKKGDCLVNEKKGWMHYTSTLFHCYSTKRTVNINCRDRLGLG